MIGARCRILLGDYDGNVVGKRSYLGEADRFAVRYLDSSGPQERWFQAHEISFDGREAEGNVVEFRRMA
ncbi:hypothetical protein [Mesorhizobium sp.]|uniref:hypothetical protein n=1 Tax=Mesorhizobium sp. TaxID=1871066 RepID=UPI001219493B|nr:hypothetical protein [Mesorhizobium sp.]TIN83057.1 MAG: hypothetical protein E5X97_27370 [Mesorhizobium sp.]